MLFLYPLPSAAVPLPREVVSLQATSDILTLLVH